MMDEPEQDEEDLLRSTALRTAQSVLLARQRAERELREERRTLEILNATWAAIAPQLDLKAAVQTVTDAATKVSGAEFGAFFYNQTDESGNSFMLYTLSGARPEQFESFGHPRATALFGPTFEGKPAIRIDNVHDDPRYGKSAPHFGMPEGHLPVCSYLAVPVVSRSGEAIGGLFFGHSQPGIFSERTEKTVTAIAAQAAIAIDNGRLYEAAQREIARREKAENALRRADRMKDEFLATLAHELRNPLAPIRQAVSIWATPDLTPEKLQWCHQVVERQSQHMALLLNDLLDISRITRAQLSIRKQSTSLDAVIDAAIETAAPLIQRRYHSLQRQVEPGIQLNADPLRLAQIISNLITNAAKYTDPGGTITVTAQQDNDRTVIAVSDTGIGIDPEILPHIFEMFSQNAPAIDRVDNGLGIGLALVRGLVKLHGGYIEASSHGLGCGSRFTVYLPGSRADTPPAPRPVPQAKPAASPQKVLIADDNIDMAESIKMYLGLMGHDVMAVYDGDAAATTFESSHFDFVIMDIGMPKLNGYQAARRIRQSASGNRTRLVALTGWGQENDRELASDAGFDHHFTKPVDPAALAALLDKHS